MTDHVVLQQSPAAPAAEALAAALKLVKRFTEADAVRMARGAHGILARDLSREEALLVRAALEQGGVPAACLPARQLPILPQARYVKRMELQPAALVVYDPLGRGVPVPWLQVAVISAGAVRHFGTTQTVTEEWVRHYSPLTGSGYRLETDVRHKVEENTRLFMEILLVGAAMRFEVEAENFLFKFVVDRPDLGVREKLAALVALLAQHAPHAGLNHGAAALRANPSAAPVYSSRQALSDETVWLLWLQAQQSVGGV
jgi:hypothetical protein